MTDLFCHDAQGYPVEFFTQWDLNQVVIVDGIDVTTYPAVKIRNKQSTASIVVRPSMVEDGISIDVPNILLQKALPVIFEIFYEYDDGTVKTRYIFSVPVVPSQKPEDYTMVDNVDYANWVEIQERAEELLDQLDQEREVDILIVGPDEPDLSDGVPDIIWFDTSMFQ